MLLLQAFQAEGPSALPELQRVQSYGHLVAGAAKYGAGFLKAVGGDEHQVAVVARGGPDGELAGGEGCDDGAEHPRRFRVVRVIAVPQRRPSVLGRVGRWE